MKWIDYREKLGVGFDDCAKFEMLKNKILNFIDILQSENAYTKPEYRSYLIMVGEKFISNNPYEGISYSLKITQNAKELISKYIAFCNTYSNYYERTGYYTPEKNVKRATIIQTIKNSLNSLNIQFEILQDKDGIYIFPKGAEELDKALVSEPLQWLNAYPSAHNAFIQALKEYSNYNGNNASNIADYFRKALETFFQEFFGGGKSLENYLPEYGKYLKENSVPKEISNNFQKILDAYTNFNNNYAKHHDKTTQKVLEYILYETGNIIRLLIILKNN